MLPLFRPGMLCVPGVNATWCEPLMLTACRRNLYLKRMRSPFAMKKDGADDM